MILTNIASSLASYTSKQPKLLSKLDHPSISISLSIHVIYVYIVWHSKHKFLCCLSEPLRSNLTACAVCICVQLLISKSKGCRMKIHLCKTQLDQHLLSFSLVNDISSWAEKHFSFSRKTHSPTVTETVVQILGIFFHCLAVNQSVVYVQQNKLIQEIREYFVHRTSKCSCCCICKTERHNNNNQYDTCCIMNLVWGSFPMSAESW